ncbi:YbfB/YjiJ family MFS transporter [Pseudomonas alliivorans]|nr:YbfB/YjiJ family MFS transporter [Pseudomonas alliivorans]
MKFDAAFPAGNATRSMLWSPLGAAMIMAVGMGFGRFAFTGVYPAMVSESLLTVHEGTWAASANYAGYLIGALVAARLASYQAYRWVIISLVMSVLCLVVLAFVHAPGMIIAIRGVAGVFSALSMIAASLWLLQHKGHHEGAPMLFAGVGVGIFLSAEIIASAQHLGLKSPELWLMLGICAAILGGLAILKMDRLAISHAQNHSAAARSHQIPLGAWPLILAYGLAGFGYIITATYLPMLIKDSLGDVNPVHVWAAFGLGAAPSCYFWHRIHMSQGTHQALRFNLLVQAAGVVLPVVFPNAFGYVASALIVGGTFMGTVTIAMPAAKRISHMVKFNLIAVLTAAYGIGQILGPLLANYLYALSGAFDSSLVTASLALVISASQTFRPFALKTSQGKR